MIPIYLINLDRSTDRLAGMQEQFARLGVSYHRVKAIDGLDVPGWLGKYFAHVRQKGEPIMGVGGVGCYASHLQAYLYLLTSNAACALVLEDDAALPANLQAVIDETLAALPLGWDFVHLVRPPRRAVRPLARLPYGGTLVRYSRIPAGCAAYLISRSGAAKLLNPDIARVWAIDTDTRRPWLFGLDSYGVAPPPIGELGLPTTIWENDDKAKVHVRRGLPRPTAYTWLNMPLHSPRGMIWNARKLGLLWWLKAQAINGRLRFGEMVLGRPSTHAAKEIAAKLA